MTSGRTTSVKQMRTIAIFDFCQTLINCQTANPFLLYLAEVYPTWSRKLLIWLIDRLANQKLLYGTRKKKALAFVARGLTKAEIDSAAERYVTERLLPNETRQVRRLLDQHLEAGREVAIVSGGFKEYIDQYAKIAGIGPNKVVANNLEYANGVCTGKMSRIDCLGLNKLHLLNKKIELADIDLANSYAYSDHYSDIPLLALVGHPCVVNEAPTANPWSKLYHWQKLSLYDVV